MRFKSRLQLTRPAARSALRTVTTRLRPTVVTGNARQYIPLPLQSAKEASFLNPSYLIMFYTATNVSRLPHPLSFLAPKGQGDLASSENFSSAEVARLVATFIDSRVRARYPGTGGAFHASDKSINTLSAPQSVEAFTVTVAHSNVARAPECNWPPFVLETTFAWVCVRRKLRPGSSARDVCDEDCFPSTISCLLHSSVVVSSLNFFFSFPFTDSR